MSTTPGNHGNVQPHLDGNMAAQPGNAIPGTENVLLSSSVTPPAVPSDSDGGGAGMASEFDLTPSPDHRGQRVPARSQSSKRASPSSTARETRARGDTSRSPSPRITRARAGTNSRPPTRGRRSAPEVWPNADEAVHRRVATDPHAVTTDDCARQLEADREHMLVLKLAVESLHSRLLAQ